MRWSTVVCGGKTYYCWQEFNEREREREREREKVMEQVKKGEKINSFGLSTIP